MSRTEGVDAFRVSGARTIGGCGDGRKHQQGGGVAENRSAAIAPSGGPVTEHVTIEIICPDCKGSKDHPVHPWKPCPKCYGNGVLYVNAPPPNAPALYERDEPPGREIGDVPR